MATDNLEDQINGVAVTFKHLSLQAQNSGHEMHFLNPSHFFHFPAPGYPEVKLAVPFGVGKYVDRADSVHIATEGPIGLAVKLYCDRKGISYTTSYHTRFPEYFGMPSLYKYFSWFHSKSSAVLVPTQTMVNILSEKGFSSLVVWTRGVDRSFIANRKTKDYILYVGRVSKEKNLEALLSLNYPIVIVGDGPQRAEYEKKYSSAKFVGYQTGARLFKYYSEAKVFAFPSLTDTFGIVMIESIACGTPVAAFPVPGPIDIVTKETGVLSENLFEAIEQASLLNREQVKQASLHWTWENCWNIFLENLCQK